MRGATNDLASEQPNGPGAVGAVRLKGSRRRTKGAVPGAGGTHLHWTRRKRGAARAQRRGQDAHLALALPLGRKTVTAGHKVRFITAADLMLQPAAAKTQGQYFNRAVLRPGC